MVSIRWAVSVPGSGEPGCCTEPPSNPREGFCHLLGAGAWREQDRSPRALIESRRDRNREGLHASTSPYVLPFPASCCVQLHWIEDGKGKQEALAVPASMCREARGKNSQGSKGKVSPTHTAPIPGYPSLGLLHRSETLRQHSPALQSPETSAETASEKRIAAEIECRANVLENWNKKSIVLLADMGHGQNCGIHGPWYLFSSLAKTKLGRSC